MRSSAVTERYTQALFEAAKAQNATGQVGEELAELVAILDENADLARFLQHPIVTPEDKKATVDKLFAGKVHPVVHNFLRLVLDKRREDYLKAIQKQFQELLNRQQRRAVAQVTTAINLDGDTQAELKRQLEAYLEQDVTLETAVDPALLGGLQIRVGDRLIDGSIRGQLTALGRSLNERG